MSITEKIKDITVVVNDGSGVLVQPMTKEYSYVLTAKHVIQVDKEDLGKGLLEFDSISIHKSNDEKLIVRRICPHPELDIAIIVVDYDLSAGDLEFHSVERDMDLALYGYPNTAAHHRNLDTKRREWLETHALRVLEDNNQTIKCDIRDVEYDDIKGFSGGGVFYISDKDAFLAGIEYKLQSSGEYTNRIISIPAACFNAIISEYSLPPIRPVYYSDFKKLKESLFVHSNCLCLDDIRKATDLILFNSEKLLSETKITPFEIISKFNELFINLTPNSTSEENKHFWISFLEFLHIEGLMSPEVLWDDDFLKYLIKNYKFIFTTSNKGWKTNLPKLLSMNVDNLRNGGILLFIEKAEDYPEKPDTINQYIGNIPSSIANAIGVEDISNVTSIQNKSISIIHLPKLHLSCIYDNELKLSQIDKLKDLSKIRELIFNSYAAYLKK